MSDSPEPFHTPSERLRLEIEILRMEGEAEERLKQASRDDAESPETDAGPADVDNRGAQDSIGAQDQ